jgi:putative transposase
MDERLKFVARLLEGEKMAVLCRDFGISRKTGYKILERYEDTGVEGLTDRSRRPYRHANQLPFQIEAMIVRLKQEKPTWGAPKIMELLARRYPDVHRPAISTIHAVLDRHGLVKHRKGCRNRATGTGLCGTEQPNDLWCADYKSLPPRRRGASSCWRTGDTVIRSPSRTMPAATCLQLRLCNRRKK